MVLELEQVLERVSKLPEREQQALAAILELELEDEERWSRRFDETPLVLEMLVKRAKDQYAAGLCDEL